MAMLGYGMGMGGAGGAGVLQTSGMVAIEMPLLALWQRLKLLMLIVTGMALVLCGGGLFQQGGAAEWGSVAAAPDEIDGSLGAFSIPGGEG